METTNSYECVPTVNASVQNTISDWNVINEAEFRKKIRTVFKQVSNALANTLGPYGSTTIIEKYGEMHITKDGWQVLKNIRFTDITENNIMALLLRIAAQVVVKVGDGSTSSIIAANSVLEQLEKDENKFSDLRPKDFMLLLNSCVEMITSKIYNSSTKINKESFDEIYKLAYISTNGDDTIASMIKNIYEETQNPAIEYTKSKTDKTYLEIVDGYKASNMTYVDDIFINNDDGTCVIDNPYFLMFDHKVDLEHSMDWISAASRVATEHNSRLVVIAPNYDKFLLDSIARAINLDYRQNGTSRIVYVRAGLVNNNSHAMYNDFSIMAGAQLVKEQFYNEMAVEEVNQSIDTFIGQTTKCTIGKKDTVISGFISRNENMYNKILEDATYKYNTMADDYRERGIIDLKLNEVKSRVDKLKGKMGIINVGGYSSLEKVANFDLVEDAVKACESAYYHGYNCGGNLIIPKTIDAIIAENAFSDSNINKMLCIIKHAFIDVFKKVLQNKLITTEDDELENIVNECLIGDNILRCYDLTKDTYSTDVINSCITDIEILKATASIISLLESSNQYIAITTSNEQSMQAN